MDMIIVANEAEAQGAKEYALEIGYAKVTVIVLCDSVLVIAYK